MFPALHTLSRGLAGLLALCHSIKDAIHDDAAENDLVVQVRSLRPFLGDVPELADPAQLIRRR
jgi:hypothetical protein